MSLAQRPYRDLTEAAAQLQAGAATSHELLQLSMAAADSPACGYAYIRRFDGAAQATASAIDTLRASGHPQPVLAGLAVSIKDLFDVAGQPTTAASASMWDAAPATADCPAVARLRSAGAVLTGHTNLTEFAFSGVGLNPHHGTPANPSTAAMDATPRIPGGSTSGGAVTVASGAAWAALGSDTGGSIRIPAALQGLVGFKNTQRLTSTEGAVPLSTTLDTACAVTLSVRDAVLVHEVLAQRRVALQRRLPKAWRLGVPGGTMLDQLDATVARAFERSLSVLSKAGFQIETLQMEPLERLAGVHARGTFAAAEAWAWHRHRLAQRAHQYDPRVAARIRLGEAMGAADYVDLLSLRRAWMADMATASLGLDALLSPTVPMVAPAMQPLVHSDEAFQSTNRSLLRNPSVVNLLDGCALSLPCHQPGELPVGLMVWAGAMADDQVLSVSLEIESALAASLR